MRRATRLSLIAAASVIGGRLLAQAPPAPAPAYSFAEPGISPDGREIAFASGGSLWSVAAAGGDAHLLVSDGASDRRPLFSPDGRDLAFMSTRTGGGDIYVLTLATGDVRRLTADDGSEQLDAWSHDGRWIYFSTTGHDIAGMNDLYRVSIDGGTPMPVSDDRYVNEFDAAPSPDGRRVAFVARGVASSQWWRKSGSHLDRSELWLLDLSTPTTSPAAYGQLTPRDSRQEWPMWSGDGRALFYVSDRLSSTSAAVPPGVGASFASGAENVWRHALEPATPPHVEAGALVQTLDARDRALTTFQDGRLLWPSITADGRTIAFERNFGIWTLDTSNGRAHEVPIVRRGTAVAPPPEHVRETSGFSDLALAPDGKKIAFIVRGDVFAASTAAPGEATRVTSTAALESQPIWTPDSRQLVYVSARGDGQQLYRFDFAAKTETALTTGTATDLSPVASPDGASVAFLRNRRELHILTLATGADRTIATGTFSDTIESPRPAWSPDGRWIALFTSGTKAFTNVALVAIDGGPVRPISFLSNSSANTIVWSHDGSYLLFDTRQRTEDGHLARVDLTPRAPRFREDGFEGLFKGPRGPQGPQGPQGSVGSTGSTGSTGSAGPSVVPVFEAIRDRLSLLPIGLDVGEAVVSPDGKTACVVASSGGQTNLYAYSLDELSTDRPVARQLTTTAGEKSDPAFSPDGKDVYYLDAGRVAIVSVERRESRPLAVTAEVTIDFSREKQTIFDQAWTLMRDNFFDPAFHGVDWNHSRAIYGARVAAAGTADEMRRLLSLMVGELNASHLGVTAPGGAAPVVGRLGVAFDVHAYETTGRLVVSRVIPLGAAALARDLRIGDAIVAIDGQTIGPYDNLDARLANTIGRRVIVTVAGPGGAAPREVVVQPTSQGTEKTLLYRDWVETNRDYVLKASGGRLGYVHMLNMSAAALDQLQIDLDADNHGRDGVVIDIRNNSGGFVNAYALDIFTRQPYLRMSTRALAESPARGVLGQRALEAPTVLVTNQHSLSDAEDFSEGYRAMKLGSIVGEPTAGWIIYTWDLRLVDGTTFRLPHMRVRAADSSDMEGHPRPVDVEVTRPVGETLGSTDTQLDEAVRTLLKKLGKSE